MRHFTTGASSRRSIRYVSISALSIALACCLFPGSAGCQDASGPEEASAIARIHELGGSITRDETRPGHPVRFVTFEGERFTDADLALLTGMKDLSILNLRNTRVTGAGLDRLNGLTTLTGLTLWTAKLDDDFAENLSRLTNITMLNMMQCKISGRGLDRLTRMNRLRSLLMIDVTITGELAEHAQPGGGLRMLAITRSDISGPMAAYLGTLFRLHSLTLEQCAVNDSALSHLKGLTDLRTLGLGGTNITDAGLESLEGMTNLTTLNLSRTAITDAGLSHLEGMTRLRTLNLDGTKVTEAGVKKLHAVIPQVAAIPFDAAPQRVLPRFSRAPAPALPVPAQTAADPAQQQAIARIYELGGSVVRDEKQPDRPVIYATLTGTKFTDADLAALTALPELTNLTLMGTNIKGEGLDHLGKLTKLTVLSLLRTEATDTLIEHVAKLTSVNSLSLNGCTLTFAGFDRIATQSNVRTLHLYGVRITGDAAEPPKTASMLKDVQLTRTVVSDALIDYLAEMRELTTLRLAESMVTDAGVSRLKGLTNLRFLRLNGTKITDAGIDYLKGMTELFELDLSRTDVTDAGLDRLKGFTRLRILDLAGTRVSDAGIQELQKALPNAKPRSSATVIAGANLATSRANLAPARAATTADVSKVPPYDDFIVVPFRIHVLQSKTLEAANCTITYVAVSEAAATINAIWSKAGIHFGLESIIREEAVQVERFKAVAELNQGQLPAPDVFAYLLPASSRVFDGLHVYLFHELPLNGTSLLNGSYLAAADAAITIEKPQLKPVAGGSKAPLARVAARGLGQALSLTGRSDEVGLLSSGTNGVGLSEAEVGRARQVARTIPGAMAVDALTTAAGAAANSGDLAAARRYWTWLSEIPGDGAAEARRRLDALPAVGKP